MDERDEKEAPKFQVVDRRYKSIVDEGKPLDDKPRPVEPAMPPPPPRPAGPARTNAPPSHVAGHRAQGPRAGGGPAESPAAASGQRSPDITFDGFIRSLYAQTMMQMGVVEGPMGQGMEPDMEGARQTIDILDLLKEKTKGNLSPQEDSLLSEALTASRLAYVEVNKRRR